MSKIVERHTYAGHVCEVEIYRTADSRKAAIDRAPKPRFESEEDREKHKRGMAERRLARLFNQNFTPAGWYVTLTFGREHECHDIDEARAARKKYIQELRRRYPDLMWCAVEGQGSRRKRFHLHIVAEIPRREGDDEAADRERQEAFRHDLYDLWGMGPIKDMEHLWDSWIDSTGSDNGRNYRELAEYLVGHWLPAYGGKRYACSRNLARPEQEEAQEIEEDPYTQFERPCAPDAPEGYVYCLFEVQLTTYGYKRYTFVLRRIPEERSGRTPKFRETRVRYRLGWERSV